MHDFDIRLFIRSADVVSLAGLALRQHSGDRFAMIFHVKPIAHILAIAVHRQRLALLAIEDQQREQKNKKKKQTKKEETKREQQKKTKREEKRAHQMIRGRFGSRIRAIG